MASRVEALLCFPPLTTSALPNSFFLGFHNISTSVRFVMPGRAALGTTSEVEIGTAAAAAAAAAAGPAWRQFSFFESSPVRDVNDFAKSPATLRSPNEVAAVCQCPVRPPSSALTDTTIVDGTSSSTAPLAYAAASSSAENRSRASKPARKQPCTLVGTIQGTVRVLDPETFQELTAWDAFSSAGVAGRITHLSCDARGRVVSLGEEDSSRFPVLRIWDIRTGRAPSRPDNATSDANGSGASKICSIGINLLRLTVK